MTNHSRHRFQLGMSAILPAVFLGAFNAGANAQAAADRVKLIPHRAVYDVVLDTSKPAKGIEGAKARIVFDYSGDACDGYQLNFRQVTEIQASEGPLRVIDSRTSYSEAGDGSRFRFINENRIEGAPSDKSDGEVKREGDGYKVVVKPPKSGEASFGNDVLFPTAHLKAVIRAARAGNSTLNTPLFDGSEDGQQVYDTLTVIGRKIAGGPSSQLEKVLQKPVFDNVPRWPVTISYFKRGSVDTTPSYIVSFELFENGVTRGVKLDYRDFVLAGNFTSLDLLKESDCER
ncbi:MAG: cell envelope integrity EipB family protein [Bosea sp. (in: a-proteobacteria)]